MVHENIRCLFQNSIFFCKNCSIYTTWWSTLYWPLRKSDQTTIGKTHCTLQFQKWFFDFNLITQRGMRYFYWEISGMGWQQFCVDFNFWHKNTKKFKFLEGVMIYNYKSGSLIDYCFDTKFTHFEPSCTIFALLLHYHIRYDLNRTS